MMFRLRAVPSAAGITSFDLATVAVVKVDLPLAEPDFFAGLTGDFRQGDRGGSLRDHDPAWVAGHAGSPGRHRHPCVANKRASMAGSSRRGRLLGWFAENPATALAQAGPLLVHAGSNTLHTRNFRRTKSKNVAGAKPALIVLRKCVTRCRQRRQTKSQHRCDPWITNCEQINSHISHMVSPGLTDVAVATRRLAVLESSHHRIDASIDASRFSITRAPLFCIGADSAMAVP